MWIPNNRGSKFCRSHKYLDPDTDREFWDFSFDEIGIHDTKAVIKYIKKHSGEDKISFIGFSQGATQVLCALIQDSEWYKENMNILINLGPLARISSDMSTIARLALSNKTFFSKFL